MTRVDVDFSGVRRKIGRQAQQRGRYAVANQALADMNPFVPKKEGVLRMTGHIEGMGEYAVWNTPYAAKMFYMMMFNYTTPGTGPRWDNKAKAIFMSDWVKAYTKGAGY